VVCLVVCGFVCVFLLALLQVNEEAPFQSGKHFYDGKEISWWYKWANLLCFEESHTHTHTQTRTHTHKHAHTHASTKSFTNKVLIYTSTKWVVMQQSCINKVHTIYIYWHVVRNFDKRNPHKKLLGIQRVWRRDPSTGYQRISTLAHSLVYKLKDVGSEWTIRIKQKGVYRVENPPPRSLLGGQMHVQSEYSPQQSIAPRISNLNLTSQSPISIVLIFVWQIRVLLWDQAIISYCLSLTLVNWTPWLTHTHTHTHTHTVAHTRRSNI